MSATVHQPGEGERIAVGPTATVLKMTSEQNDGAFTFAESTVAPGFEGPPVHFHERMLDTFYVLEGTLTLHVDGQELELGPGGFATVSTGSVHTFRNRSDAPVRFLNVNAPGGLEGYLREMAELMAGGGFAPEVLAEVAARYDVHFPEA